MTEHVVAAQPLTAQAWAPFGWLPVADADPTDGVQTLSFASNDPHLNVIHHDTADVVRADGRFDCQRLFRHRTHTQALLAPDARCVIVVAPTATLFDAPAAVGDIAAFVIEAGAAVVLHPGTWHWGPYAVDGPRVTMFNVQGRGWPDDNTSQDLRPFGPVVVRTAPE